MAEIENHSDLHWPPSDIRVDYDRFHQRITFTKISTGELLKAYEVNQPNGLQNGDCITPQGVVRPYVDLTVAPLWRRLWNRLRDILSALAA